MVINVYLTFNCNRLRIVKALGNFRKFDSNNEKKNVRSARGPFPGLKCQETCNVHVGCDHEVFIH